MNIEKIAENAKQLLEKDKELSPILFIEDTDGKETAIDLRGLGSDEKHDKYVMMKSAGILTARKKIKVKEIVLVAESWIAMVKGKGINKENVENIIPSEYPDRKEAIVISSWDISNNKKKMHMQVFEREEGKITWKEVRKEKIEKGSQLNIFEPFIE